MASINVIMPEAVTSISSASWEELLISQDKLFYNDDKIKMQQVSEALWIKYLNGFKAQAFERLRTNKIINGKMKIAHKVIGPKPEGGYPLYICLHGGGGCSTYINDSQWENMQSYYKESITQGVYAVPRGITDTWNLHFVNESYELYDRLIADMILCYDINPNRVYIMGVSAGGDGVYQITPRMADRLAAANMSAGHHNGVSLINLFNVPFLIQVGALDTAYNRHRACAEYGVKLNELQKLHPDGYTNECFVHLNRGHGISDNDANRKVCKVASDLISWLNSNDQAERKLNTNAIDWTSKFLRDPIPIHIIWDVPTRANRCPLHDFKEVQCASKLFYWLDISGQKEVTAKRIEAKLDKRNNSIEILHGEECGDWLRILFNNKMLDITRVISVKIGEFNFTVQLNSSIATLTRTLLERGDPNYIFSSEVILEKKENVWNLSGTF